MTAVRIADDGGDPITVTTSGLPLLTGLRVFVLDDANVEHRCYSGVLGQGLDCFADSATQITFVPPNLPIGGPYAVRIYNAGSLVKQIDGAVIVEPRSFRSKTFAMRQLFSPIMAVGERTADLIRPLEAFALFTVPSIDDIANQALTVGTPYSFTPSVTNPSGLPLTFELVGTLADGIAFSTSTGALTGTPTTPETHAMQVRVRSVAGDDITPSFNMAVSGGDRFVIAGGDTGSTGNTWAFGSSTLTKHTPATLQTWIAKLDLQTNTFVWASKWLETTLSTFAITAIAVDRADGSIYVGGYARQDSGSNVDFFDKNSQSVPAVSISCSTDPRLAGYVTKYDKDGNHAWTRAFRSKHQDVNSGTEVAGLTILPSGNLAVGVYDLRTNVGLPVQTIFIWDGASQISPDIIPAASAGAVSIAVAAIVEIDGSGAFVQAKFVEAPTSGNPGINTVQAMGRRADNGLAVMDLGFYLSGTPQVFRYGVGEGGEFAPSFTPAGTSRYVTIPTLLDKTDMHLDFVGDAQSAGANTIGTGTAVDEDGAVYSVGAADASGGADTLTVRSSGWAAPSVTHASTDTGGHRRPFYAKHNAAGVAQWVKGAGSNSVTTGAVEGVSDCDAVGGKPFIVGNSFTASPKVVLDQGLGTEVTIDAGSAPFPRLWFAKLNKADGTILYAKKINASANVAVVKDPYSKLAATGATQFAVSVPAFDDSASLTFGPGEAAATTVNAIAASRCAAVGVYNAADGTLIKAKRYPDSMGTVGNMLLTALNGSPL